jgi:hypothetical protein
MKVYVITFGDWEGTFYGDAVFSTEAKALDYLQRLHARNYPDCDKLCYVDAGFDARHYSGSIEETIVDDEPVFI